MLFLHASKQNKMATNSLNLRMKKKWSERDTMKFVELYEAEAVLWNTEHPEYKIKNRRREALKRIARGMDIEDFTTLDVNNKINIIRSTYSQEIVKIKKSMEAGGGGDSVYVPRIAWFETAERFLSSAIKSRKSLNLPVLDYPKLNIRENSEDIPEDHELEDPTPDISDNPLPHTLFIPSPDSDDSADPEPKQEALDTKTLPQLINKAIDTLQVLLLNKREAEDEFYHFGQNIACQLRKLPLIDALDLEADILKIIARKRMLHHEESLQSFEVDEDSEAVPLKRVKNE